MNEGRNNQYQVMSETTDEMKGNVVREKKSGLWEKFNLVVMVIVLVTIIVIGCGSGCIRCTYCGANDNRLVVYASGTTEDGIEYESCVGPAGCLGLGINSKCWPTECLSIKKADSEGNVVHGCITYYNEFGCINDSKVKSEGKYSGSATCLGIACVGEKYIETEAVTTQAKEQNTCLGVGCGNSNVTASKGYNAKMPRQFEEGCWSDN